ncbi:MAG: SBBP repeat-containing protein [Pyrinomonadaceae bacterium]
MPFGDAGRAALPFAGAPSHQAAAAPEAYGKIEMSFEENCGQTDAQVKYLARGAGYTVFLTESEAVFVLARKSAAEADGRELLTKGDAPRREDAAPTAVLRMKLEGANPRPAVSGVEELVGKVNYFVGSDAARWQTDIPTYGRVRYDNVYEGVGLVFYGKQSQLEYDFVVAPGADSGQVALGFEGADKVEVDAATGDLLLRVGEGTLRQTKPTVYQEVDGARRAVEGDYEPRGEGRVGFRVGEYDRSRPLVIDPVLLYSTYMGGSETDIGNDIAVDSSGSAYVTGFTVSVNFPTHNPIQSARNGSADAFVMKINAAGTAIVYSTYLGGGNSEGGSDIAVDSSGSAYVIGATPCIDFPTANPMQPRNHGGTRDAFVTKLTPSGSALAYSTYLGGGDSDSGNAFVLMEYFGYLRRDPDAAPDADFSGYNFWLGKLDSFSGDYRRAEMVKGFISSDEYRRRFGQ